MKISNLSHTQAGRIVCSTFFSLLLIQDAVSQFESTIIAEPTNTKPAGSAVSQRKSSQESGAKKSQLQLIAGAIKRKRYEYYYI